MIISKERFRESLSGIMQFDFRESGTQILAVWMPGGDRNNQIIVVFDPKLKGHVYALEIISRGEKTLEIDSSDWNEILERLKSHVIRF